jgi:hypothetical protein
MSDKAGSLEVPALENKGFAAINGRNYLLMPVAAVAGW